MNARNNRDRSPFVHCPPGSGIRPKFRKTVDPETGSPKLVRVGETDQHALIQSFAEETDINRLVARYQAGDHAALQRVQGLYCDISAMPQNAVEALNLGVLARDAWDSLTAEQREKYGDLGGFLNAICSVTDILGEDPIQDPVQNENQEPISGGAE